MKNSILLTVFGLVFAISSIAQTTCFSPEESKKVIDSLVKTEKASENKIVRKELLKMVEERLKLNAKISDNFEKNKKFVEQANDLGSTQLARVCGLIKENGWLTKEMLKEDGFEAFLFLLVNNKAYKMQREMFPVLVEAAKKGYISNTIVASQIDSIRISGGLPQLFGTQATVDRGFIYLYPILNEEKVDNWRKQYDLPPLARQIQTLEDRYLLPVLKMQRIPTSPYFKQSVTNKQDTAALGISNDENEVVKVDTRLVSLNIRILGKDLKAPSNLTLAKDDFTIFEDDKPQEVSFFSTTEQPFDLVLLLDFSGSTVEKRGLIKKAAQRFIEFSRPNDRIAIVCFAGKIELVSDLTADKSLLVTKLKEIDIKGGSPIWDSLKFTYDNIIKKQSLGRRSAIVFMTDGIDGSRYTTFSDAVEIARNGDTTIFPVYLEIENSYSDYVKKLYGRSRTSLSLLAEESGGQFYAVDNIKDLNGVYEQIINDLGKVYSIGYEPTNEDRDGFWRKIDVKIKDRPDLVTRTRRGYYAR